jgi:hypothetical protein
MMMNYRRLLWLTLCVVLLQACSGGNDSQSAADQQPASTDTVARVFIASPANGAAVSSPVTVVFGIENFALAPAGTPGDSSGHHHLLIDTDLPPLDQPIPADANHQHFGKAQTEITLDLSPGEHTLQLLLGDGSHVPHATALISETITITVTEAPAAVE